MSKVRLGDVSESCLGKMLDKSKNKGEYQPYLANINVRWGSFDTKNLQLMKFEEHESERYGLMFGDLIICEGGEPGRCAIWRDEIPNMKIQKALHRLRPHESLDVEYLYYWFLLAGRSGWLERHFIKTTIQHLTGEKLKDIEIDMPPSEVQKKIGNILSLLDKKIQLNQKINQELEAMAKTLYDYWFVQFDFPDVKGKPYRSSGGEMVYCEELKREIPRGWKCTSIGDILESPTKTKRYKTNEYLSDGKIPIIDQSTDFIVGYTNEDESIVHYHKGCVVFGDHTRIVKFINFPFARGADGTQVMVSKNENISDVLLYLTVKSIDLSNQGYARHFKFLKDKQISVPENSVNRLFEEYTSVLFSKISQNIFETQELTKLRDWLLPLLMNGQAWVE